MTINRFNDMYGNKGGMRKLSTMREEYETLKSISLHFGVSKERVRQWMIEMFGERYDPRYSRRNKKIETIKNLIRKYGVEKTKALYSGINKSYLKEAIKTL